MKYTIKVNKVEKEDKNIKGFASVVFGDSYKITNIAILENKDKGTLFVSMPRYKSSELGEDGSPVYKDVCNPITAEFREELYGNIIKAYEQADVEMEVKNEMPENAEMPAFSINATPYERQGSNLKGLARIYFEDSFIVNNVSILQGKDNLFVAMPSYKTKQVDDNGKAVYQDICYPVTKEFRAKLYDEVIEEYEKAKEKRKETSKEDSKEKKPSAAQKEEEPLPFR